MDLKFSRLMTRYRMRIRGVVHIGGHMGQEAADYGRAGIWHQIWIEAHPETFAKMVASLPRAETVRAFNVACGAVPGRAEMHLLSGNEGASNSMLEAKLHLERWPQFRPGGTVEVDVVRLDDLMAEQGLDAPGHNLLVLDIQGFELECLRGAEHALRAADYVISEVSAVELYKGGCLVGDLDAFLGERGFVRVETKWAAGCSGDAFYARPRAIGAAARLRLAVLGGRRPNPPRRGSEVRLAEQGAAQR